MFLNVGDFQLQKSEFVAIFARIDSPPIILFISKSILFIANKNFDRYENVGFFVK